ncbi:alpha/beta hydrolase [Microbacterium sp. BK668]|uniref:alpha/beta fold hydrolase n=1 Tax=Microbacterium sp. BK668 TaxID=2512118 RepID=UPI00105D9DDB|nr:alpha/beta hydrolase [Microbacterium sp. BK668]TDN90717.1 pimeloyl-ACP methyl ester carboxylesterase [Microbacterium sp. BK668]
MPIPQRRLAVGPLVFGVVESPGPEGSSRPPVVLVHGIGMSHRYLSKLHALLAAEGRVFSIDLPGFGGLPKPPHDVDVPAMASGLADVVASLDAGPVVLIGQSMGCQWVVELAVQRPDLVAQVVTIGPVVDAGHRSVLAQTAALAVDSLREPPNVNALVLTDYIRCGIPWYLTQLRHMVGYPIEERVAVLPVPLLIVRGGRDPIAGEEWCRELRDRAGSARLVVIPGHPHNVQQSAPRATFSALEALVTQVGTER